jgi:hypothetical protein
MLSRIFSDKFINVLFLLILINNYLFEEKTLWHDGVKVWDQFKKLSNFDGMIGIVVATDAGEERNWNGGNYQSTRVVATVVDE